LANPSRRSGQQIVYKTVKLVKTPRERGVVIRLLWVPGHAGVAGNDAADKLAKKATGPFQAHKFKALVCAHRVIRRK